MPDAVDLFASLRRYPDVEAPNLFAVDATDRLILDEAATALDASQPGTVAVIGDHYGALTLGAAAVCGARDIRVYQDPLTGQRALENNARMAELTESYRSCELGKSLLIGAKIVLLQLPRGLAELTEIAEAVARYADPEVVLYAGGRDKHISTAMNEVLGRSFSNVQATRGRQKSRALIASGPVTTGSFNFPVIEHLADFDLDVVAHGAVFGGAKLDIGTRFLLEFTGRMRPRALDGVDLGCGTAILAVTLAKARPQLSVTATDQSAAAVQSAEATALANGVADRITALRDDAMSKLPDASQDLVVCNPPFHVGAAVHTGDALKMFTAAGRVLRPGGEMWTVYNTHLNYRGALDRLVGRTDIMGRNQKFTVTRSIR